MRRFLLPLALVSILAAAEAQDEPRQEPPSGEEDYEIVVEPAPLDGEGVEEEPLEPLEPLDPRQELFLAIELGDLDGARQALRKGAGEDLNRGDPSPLATAALHDNSRMVELLLEAGGDPTATVDSPLEEAIRNENPRIVALLLRSGARASGDRGRQLFALAQRGSLARQLSRLLLEGGGAPDLCLAAAVDRARVELIELCLEHGAAPASLPPELNVLSVALKSGDAGFVDRLLARGLDDRVLAGSLAAAVEAGDLERVKLALSRGGAPAFAHLESAVSTRHPEIAEHLLRQSPPEGGALFAEGDVVGLVQQMKDLGYDALAAELRRRSGLTLWTAERVWPLALAGLVLLAGALAIAVRRSRLKAPATVAAVELRPAPRRPRSAPAAPPATPGRPPASAPPPSAGASAGATAGPEPSRATVAVPGLASLPAASPDPGGAAAEAEARAPFELRMPEVDLERSPDVVFAEVRQAAAGEIVRPDAPDRHQIVVVTPQRMTMLQPCPAPGTLAEREVAALERLLPSTAEKNVAVIAYTDLEAVNHELAKAVPFIELLTGLGYLGHAVWIFEGHVSALAAGLEQADVLIVDDGMVPYLPGNWRSVAQRVMRGSEILLHERRTGSLRKLA